MKNLNAPWALTFLHESVLLSYSYTFPDLYYPYPPRMRISFAFKGIDKCLYIHHKEAKFV